MGFRHLVIDYYEYHHIHTINMGGDDHLLALSEKVYERACQGDKENITKACHVEKNIGSYAHLMDSCVKMLRRGCLEELQQNEMMSGSVDVPTALEIIGPSLKRVLEEQAIEHEEAMVGMKLEIQRLERERRMAMEVSTVQQQDEIDAKLQDDLEKHQTEIDRLEGEISELRKQSNAIESDLENARDSALEWKQRASDKAEQCKALLKENRELHSIIKDLRGNVRIYTRIRPCGVTGDASNNMVRCNEEESTLQVYSQRHREWRQYTFDRVFGESATQESIYMEATSLIRSVMDGHTVTIFAYGQTGSGKTHTMQYLNKKALEDLFVYQEDEDMTYSFNVQLLEIYNDRVRDLLSGSSENLKIQSTRGGSGSNVPDAIQVNVATVDDVDRILQHGTSTRSVGATHMNDQSSRSHQILTVMVDCIDPMTQTVINHGCLNLIDLAGSERLDRSKAEGVRKEETKHINSSLSALGRVMNGLAEKHDYISFRDSKLTQLLEDSLSGRSKSMMFMHISPEESSVLETMSTLNFGKGIVDRVVVKR